MHGFRMRTATASKQTPKHLLGYYVSMISRGYLCNTRGASVNMKYTSATTRVPQRVQNAYVWYDFRSICYWEAYCLVRFSGAWSDVQEPLSVENVISGHVCSWFFGSCWSRTILESCSSRKYAVVWFMEILYLCLTLNQGDAFIKVQTTSNEVCPWVGRGVWKCLMSISCTE